MGWIRGVTRRAAALAAIVHVGYVLTVAGAVLALPDGPSCPHHESGRACTMANCPMRTAHSDDGTARLVCPTDPLVFAVSFGAAFDMPVNPAWAPPDALTEPAPPDRFLLVDHRDPVRRPPPRA